ncbi:MAG: molybdate ABC transporter substrate-binding protein [Halocynthiibacter sp.]
MTDVFRKICNHCFGALAGSYLALAPSLAASCEHPRILVATAANFLSTSRALAADYQARTGCDVDVASGSTGLLYTQITRGAPFDVFFSADQKRADLLLAEGYATAVKDYARGQLVLYHAQQSDLTPVAALKFSENSYIAMADPALAPYGLAAKAWLQKEGLFDPQNTRFVVGENIAQAFGFAASGNVEFAFVAKSQIQTPQQMLRGQIQELPKTDYPAITQRAALLSHGENHNGGRQFWEYLDSTAAIEIITGFGYDHPNQDRMGKADE